MNTFIKRGMMLALSLVFIGAAVVPACAQKKGIVKGAKVSLGKKPPLTGTAPVVKPVTPRVPPTLKGAAQIPTRFAVPDEALNTVVERETSVSLLSQKTLQKVLQHNLRNLPKEHPYWLFGGGYEDFGPFFHLYYDKQYISFIPIENITINPKYEDEAITLVRKKLLNWNPSDLMYSGWVTVNPRYSYKEEELKNTIHEWRKVEHLDTTNIEAVIETLKKVDQFFFVEHNGQVLVRMKGVFTNIPYGFVLSTFAREIHMKNLYIGLSSRAVEDFIKLRNRQIIEAFIKNEGIESLEETKPAAVNVTDYRTSQRITEEIKDLLKKNLDPQNPLRQAIEGTLEQNGYIAPAKLNLSCNLV